jgi:CHASE2 domain-containing sensor protein
MTEWLPDWMMEAVRWAWVPAIAAIGGLMAAFHRASRGETKFWSMETMFGVIASALLGGISYGVLKHYGVSGPLLGSVLGAIGFIGPKIITDLYDWMKSKGQVGKQ